MFFSLCGIPGVGKTTVKQYVLKLALDAGLNVQDAHRHRILYELAGVSSKLQYIQLPLATRRKANIALVDRLYALEVNDPNGIRLRDDHFVYPYSDGSYFMRPLHPMDYFYLAGILILTADPSTIITRRIGDGLALRHDHANDTLATATAHQFLEMSTACQQAAILGIPFRVIENTSGAVEDAAREVLHFIRKPQAI